MWLCYLKFLKDHQFTHFLSIVIVVLVKVKTFGKQFVLSRSWDSADSTQNLQGWRRGEKIQQLSVTTVSCEKVATSLNLLLYSRDLPFIQFLLLLRLSEISMKYLTQEKRIWWIEMGL